MKTFLISLTLTVAQIAATIGMVEYDHYGATVYLWAFYVVCLILYFVAICMALAAIKRGVNQYPRKFYDKLRAQTLWRESERLLGLGLAAYMIANNFGIIGVLSAMLTLSAIALHKLSLSFELKDEEK